MLDSDTAILDSNTLLSYLRFTQKHSSSTMILTQFNVINLMMAAKLNSSILNSAILDSAILHKKTSLIPTLDDAILYSANLNSTILIHPFWCVLSNSLTLLPPFAQKILHSFILTQLDDGSHLEFCHLEFGHLGFNHLFFLSNSLMTQD